MKPWRPQFDVYEARLQGDRLFVRIDLAAREYAPIVTHAVQLTVSTMMRAPRPDGQRSGQEAPALFELEDALVANMEQTLDALFVYVAMARGGQQRTFCVPADRPLQIESTVAKCGSPYILYEFVWSTIHSGAAIFDVNSPMRRRFMMVCIVRLSG
jgi:hypothetical protein